MVHPGFIYVLLLLAGFAVQVVCAQGMALQSAPLPVIEGKINGMDVVAQGDSVAFFAGQLPSGYSDESCAEDLHCTLHKNHTHAVQISPEGIRLLQLSPDHLEKDDDENEPGSLVLPSMTLNTLQSSSTARFEGLFISIEDIDPTPTLATLYTGNPVVDQTPGLAWINSGTMELLATMIETVNLLPMSTSSADDESTLIDPAPTEIVKVMTTIPGELDELRGRLMSSASVPVATPVQSNSDDFGQYSDEIRLETDFDVLSIRPSPSRQYRSGSDVTSSFTWSARQAPTNSGERADTTSFTDTGDTSTTQQLAETTDKPVETIMPHSNTGVLAETSRHRKRASSGEGAPSEKRQPPPSQPKTAEGTSDEEQIRLDLSQLPSEVAAQIRELRAQRKKMVTEDQELQRYRNELMLNLCATEILHMTRRLGCHEYLTTILNIDFGYYHELKFHSDEELEKIDQEIAWLKEQLDSEDNTVTKKIFQQLYDKAVEVKKMATEANQWVAKQGANDHMDRVIDVQSEIDDLINHHHQLFCPKCQHRLEWSESGSFFCEAHAVCRDDPVGLRLPEFVCRLPEEYHLICRHCEKVTGDHNFYQPLDQEELSLNLPD